MSLGIRGDADAFAEIEVRRQLQEIRHRIEGNFRHVLSLGLRIHLRRRQILRELEPCTQDSDDQARTKR